MNKIKRFAILAMTLALMSTSVTSFAMAAGEEVAMLGLGLACILPIIMLIIGIVLAIWVYKDAEKRGSSGALWLIIVIFTGIIGLIIWLVVRPPIGGKPQQQGPGTGRVCPNCGRPIPMDARTCPYCGKNFGQ